MEDNKQLELEKATEALLNNLHEMVYLVEHFIRKTNKSTALDVRNGLRDVKIVTNTFKNTYKIERWEDTTPVKNPIIKP